MTPLEVHSIAADVSLIPRWHRDVRWVRNLGDGRSVWGVHGPTGPVKWRVETTISRRPEAWGLSMRGDTMAGYLRLDIAPIGDGMSALRMSRFMGFRKESAAGHEAWWGDAQMRLQADLAHLVDVLKSSVESPRPKVFENHHLDGLRFPDATA